MVKISNSAIAIIVLILIILYIMNESIQDGLIDFFYEGDEKIDFLLERVKPIFEKDNHYTGNLEPLNRRRILDEIKVYKGKKSYTINKRKVFLCLRDENNEYYEDNMLLYVFLHELAHVICDEVGHTKKFHDIFKDLLDVAVDKNIWDPDEEIIQNYCDY